MYNTTATEESADIVGQVFAAAFQQHECECEKAPINTGCDRLAVLDEILPLTPTERACDRIKELEAQVEILKAMWSAPTLVGGNENTAIRSDGVVFDWMWSSNEPSWKPRSPVPGTAADLAEQFSKHPNLKAS